MSRYTREELIKAGFSKVGENVTVAREVKLYAIEGTLGNNVRIDTYSILTGKVTLGDNVHIAPLCFLSATGGEIVMEADSGMGPQVALLTKSDDYTTQDLAGAEKVSGSIHVGANSIIGSGCKIMPGVTIGHDASIGTACVLTRDVNAGDIVVSRSASVMTMGNRLKESNPA